MMNNIYPVGTLGKTTKDIETPSGKIEKGDRVQIIGVDETKLENGYSLLDLETEVKVSDVGYDSVYPTIIENYYGAEKGPYPVGTIGTAREEFVATSGKIAVGDNVQIIGIDTRDPNRGGYILLNLDNGTKIRETGYSSIVPTNLEDKNLLKKGVYPIGTLGIATKEIESSFGTIKKGARVKVIGIDDSKYERGYTLIDLDTEVKVSDTGYDSVKAMNIEENKETDNGFYPLGTIGIAAEDFVTLSGRIDKGDRVQIIGINTKDPVRGGYILLDFENSSRVVETGFNSIIPKDFENVNDMENGIKGL